MDNNTIFTKTGKGLGEILGKTRALSREHRKILQEVDGKARVADLLERFDLSEAKLQIALAKLLVDDFIREFGSAAPGSAGSNLAESMGDTEFSMTSPAQMDNADTHLTIGDFFRAMAPAPAANPGMTLPPHAPASEAAAHTVRHEQRQQVKPARQAIGQEARRTMAAATHLAGERARQQSEQQARQAVEKVKREIDAQAQREAEEKMQRQAEEDARRAAEKMKQEAAANAQREAEEKTRRQAAEKAQIMQEKARRQAEEAARRAAEKARQEAEELARMAAQELVRSKAREAARKIAEQLAQREAESRARQAAHEQARLQAAQRARKVAEEQARREKEAEIKRQADEQAQFQAKEKTRKAAEEQARRDAEIQAAKEADEHARLQASLRAEQQARREAEAEASRQADEQARLLAREQARLTAEAQARDAAIAQARREAEMLAKKQAKERARQQAAEQARISAAEKARSKLEQQARQCAEAQARKQAKEAARRLAKENARQEAEAAALLKAEKAAWRLEQKAAEKQAKQAAKRGMPAQESSRQVPATYATRSRKRIAVPSRFGRFMRFCMLALVLGSAAGIGMLHLLPFDDQRAQLEQIAAEQLQQPVAIQAVRLSLFPSPRWTLEGVTIGRDRQVSIERVDAGTDYESLLSDALRLHSLEFHQPTLNEEGLGWLLFGQTKNAGQSLAWMRAYDVRLASQHLDWPLFDASADIGHDGRWKKIMLKAARDQLFVELQPGDGAVRFDLTAQAFMLPFGSTLKFDKLNAIGILGPASLKISRMNGVLYDGKVNGDAELKWDDNWSLTGQLQARQLDAALLVPALLHSGRLDGQVRYAFQAKQANRLFATPRGKGSFSVGAGVIAGVDLVNWVMGDASNGSSPFNDVNGDFMFDAGKIQFSRLRLGAGLVWAHGQASVNRDNSLRGQFALTLKTEERLAHASLQLSGTPGAPRFAR